MKKVVLAVGVMLFAGSATAEQAGFYFGGGSLSTKNHDCSDCDSSGKFLELGNDVNRYFGTELKFARTEMDDFPVNVDLLYVGLNIGPDLGQHFKIYAKLGAASITQKGYGYSEREGNVAFGFGVRIAPFGDKVYLKAEHLRTDFASEDISATIFGIGLMF